MPPKYLSDIIPSTTRWYASRSANNIPLVKVNNSCFINTFFPSTLTKWNKFYTRIRNSASLNILKGRLLQSSKPLENSLYTCHNPIRIKYFTRLRLRYQKFKHGFPVLLICFVNAVQLSKTLSSTFFTVWSFQVRDMLSHWKSKYWQIIYWPRRNQIIQTFFYGNPIY